MGPKANKPSQQKQGNAIKDPLKPGSGSQALARRGERGITGGDELRKKAGVRPSTSKALTIRNGKYGSQGTGEVQLFNNKIFGQEKLEILAEDVMKTAVQAPFNLQQLKRIADAQVDFHISQINSLRDPDFFYADMVAEVESRSPPDQRGIRIDVTNDATAVAGAVGYRVHNIYTLASSWKLVCLLLEAMDRADVNDATIAARAEKDSVVRAYLYHLDDVLQLVLQLQLSIVQTYALASTHYAPYFKFTADGQMAFEDTMLKDLYKSYIDSIILDLVIPDRRYPLHVLLACLHDSLSEAPKDDKRFPQAMWDAMGDLSVVVQCLDMVEGPLHKLPPSTMQNIGIVQRFREAQRLSTEVSNHTEAYRSLVHPLNKLKTKKDLDRLWLEIEKNYEEGTGVKLDQLFELVNDRHAEGQWSYVYGPQGLKTIQEDSHTQHGSKKPKQLPPAHDEYSDMPELLSISDSSDLGDSGDEESEDEYEDDSEYDSDEEDALRDMYREVMDMSHANPEAFDPDQPEPPQAKVNGLLRALRHLKGKLFSADPALTADGRPRKGFKPMKPSAKGATKAQPQGPTGTKVTVEEVDDEDAPKKKKKKKKPKKKKKKTKTEATEERQEGEDSDEEQEPAAAEPPAIEKAKIDTAAAAHLPKVDSPVKPKAAKAPPPAARSAIYGSAAGLPSTVSLVSTISGDTAQSAHGYLRSANLLDEKVKVKTRPDGPPGLPPESPYKGEKEKSAKKEGSGFFSKVKETFKIPLKPKHKPVFNKLILGESKGAMKWESFVKFMVDMGFTYDGSTAGSSVRFDPPDPKDKSITIHKPHPDSTIQPNMIKKIKKRLEDRYKWTANQFIDANV